MFCKNCGKEIADGVQFCTYCGEKITSARAEYATTTEAPKQEETNKYGNKIYFRGAGLGFVLAFFVNIIGLILAIVFGDAACKKAAIITTCVCVGLGLIGFFFYLIIIVAAGVLSELSILALLI